MNNKKLKNYNDFVKKLELLKHFYNNKKPIISIDTEFIRSEKSHKLNEYKLLEVGYSLRLKDQIIHKHFIVKENLLLEHSLPKFNKKDKFIFKNKTEIKSFLEIKTEIKKIFSIHKPLKVGFGITTDIKLLSFNIDNVIEIDNQCKFLDSLDKSLRNQKTQLGFQTILKNYNINKIFDFNLLHNAGNDTYCFMEYFLPELIKSNPVTFDELKF